MKISAISVSGLFGIFDHVIPLNADERITIIHGPNGFGKTAILRMLDAVFNSNHSVLRTVPFVDLQVLFDDGSHLRVERSKETDREADSGRPAKLRFSYWQNGKEKQSFSPSLRADSREISLIARHIAEENRDLERVAVNTWLHMPTSVVLSEFDIIERYSDMAERLVPSISRGSGDEEWMKGLRKSVNVRLVETQRLWNFTQREHRVHGNLSMQPAVGKFAGDLAAAIQRKLTEYASLSQSLDRTFPFRVVQHKNIPDLTERQLRDALSDLEDKRSKLIEIGLLDPESGVNFQVTEEIDEHTKSVLSVYVKDVERKLSVFDEMADRLNLFMKIINERFIYKKMKINKKTGFSFFTMNEELLLPSALSSGEQHEVVLLYEFLFNFRPGSLIMIDEPELSLHVAWQVEFLRDLQDITRIAEFDVLIATHSPQIIEDRWDLTVQLKGPAV